MLAWGRTIWSEPVGGAAVSQWREGNEEGWPPHSPYHLGGGGGELAGPADCALEGERRIRRVDATHGRSGGTEGRGVPERALVGP